MAKIELTVTEAQFIELMKQVDTSTFINLVTETKVRMNKTGNPYFDRVTKISKCNYLIGNDYEKRVQNNEIKEGLEGDFQSEDLKGKKHLSKCVLIDTKTESTHYLMVERFEEIKPIDTTFCMDGNEIAKQLFEAFMVKSYPSQKQEQERKVMVITPKIENINEATIGGYHYTIQH